jgi:hypothetical protein
MLGHIHLYLLPTAFIFDGCVVSLSLSVDIKQPGIPTPKKPIATLCRICFDLRVISITWLLLLLIGLNSNFRVPHRYGMERKLN